MHTGFAYGIGAAIVVITCMVTSRDTATLAIMLVHRLWAGFRVARDAPMISPLGFFRRHLHAWPHVVSCASSFTPLPASQDPHVLRKAAWRRCRDTLGKPYLIIAGPTTHITGPPVLATKADFPTRRNPRATSRAPAGLLYFFPDLWPPVVCWGKAFTRTQTPR